MKSHKNQSGISLIEMMISLAILAIGLLALSATQSRAMMMNQSAYFRSVAADLAADLADKIRTNRTPYFLSEELAVPALKPPRFDDVICPHTTKDKIVCTQTDSRLSYMASEDLTAWKSSLMSMLPGASYTITAKDVSADAEKTKLGLVTYVVTITWLDDRSKIAGAQDQTYTTTIE